MTLTLQSDQAVDGLTVAMLRHQTLARRGAWLLAAVAAGLIAFTSLAHSRHLRERETGARAMARDRAATAARFIETKLNAMSPMATALAADLSSGALTPADLPARLRADLARDPQVFEVGVAYAPYAMDPKVKLFAPHAAREAARINFFPLEDRYDYTKSEWYTAGFKGGWGEPYFGAATQTLVVGFTAPIYKVGDTAKTTPIGVARVNLSLDNVRDLVSSVSLGQTGYGFLLSKKGVMLSYPIEDHVRRGRNMIEFSHSLSDPVRAALTEQALRGEHSEGLATSGVTKEQMWLVHEPIKLNGWVFGISIFPEEVSLEAREGRRGLIRILASVLLFAFALSLIVFHFELGDHDALWGIAISAGAILVFGIGVVWALTLRYPDRNGEQSVHILDEAALQAFVKTHEAALPAGVKPPIQIPTGILVRTLRFIDANDAVVTGSVWQKIPTARKGDVRPGVELPDGEAVDMRDVATRVQGDYEVTSWNFKATIREPSEWSRKYPFDRALIRLRLTPKGAPPGLILVPDLSAYELLMPSAMPGVEKSLILPGWTLDHSYYSYLATTLGITDDAPGGDQALDYDLGFNIVTSRRFLDPFVSSVLPIIVIVCLLFGLLIVGSKNNVKVAATGFKATDVLRASVTLLFPALIAQVNLRSRVGATEVIYIEYFYFILYIAILAVSANALAFTLKTDGVVQHRDNLIPKLAFWPAILGACFVVTLGFLY